MLVLDETSSCVVSGKGINIATCRGPNVFFVLWNNSFTSMTPSSEPEYECPRYARNEQKFFQKIYRFIKPQTGRIATQHNCTPLAKQCNLQDFNSKRVLRVYLTINTTQRNIDPLVVHLQLGYYCLLSTNYCFYWLVYDFTV